jgi:REP element-mobilizing transposase RayT
MGHTYASQLLHCVFSTKERRPQITATLKPRLYAYLGGIARQHDAKVLAIGGVDDHLHILLSLPPKLALAQAIQLLKGGSSHWVHENFPDCQDFAWQEGYGAFSVGISQLEPTLAYIKNQESHHRRQTFQEEFREFLNKHGLEWDERYVWG